MWDVFEDLSPWIRIPLALAMIVIACAILAWAPGWWARSWIFPLVLGVLLLIFGGSGG
jgi:hypothetical protein